MDVQALRDRLQSRLTQQGSSTILPQPGRILPQIRETSRSFSVLQKVEVRLLVPLQNKGRDSRHNSGPSSFAVGDTVYASLHVNGFIYLYPFAMAGSGFELKKDAAEGIHYEFI